jgi:hypothetical protein
MRQMEKEIGKQEIGLGNLEIGEDLKVKSGIWV